MAVCRAGTELNSPRCRQRRLSLAKIPSTAFIQELEVGVK